MLRIGAYSAGAEGRYDMKVLVAVASKHGSTREIAATIAEELRNCAFDADLRDVSEVTSIRGYDAVILGSAVYMGNWLPEARSFPEHHRVALSKLPVWLFSSGPVGVSDPLPHEDPKRLASPVGKITARDHHIFVGKLDPSDLGFGQRVAVRWLGIPFGDFRDWDEIRAWARDIGAELLTASDLVAH
jgi:menaquinone-dependent protoporphyrinogen oxidase